MKNILAVHLYNDFSGSPRVLAALLNGLANEHWHINLLASNTQGALSNLPNVSLHPFPYRFYNAKWRRLLMLLYAQIRIILSVWRLRRSTDVIYINTLLPFGAALMGKLLGIPVVYHLHETTVNPALLKRFLRWVANTCAQTVIYVSHFLQQAEPFHKPQAAVIPNSLDAHFILQAAQYAMQPARLPLAQSFSCLMLCSLKAYKGIFQYIELARLLPAFQFVLVLNASEEDIRSFFIENTLPDNLVIFPAQHDVHWFYTQSHLVLNLSLPDQWVETFGMTLLEAMQYGKPVIAPNCGGPAELVEHGRQGLCLNPYDTQAIAAHIRHLASDTDLYNLMAARARQRARAFDPRVSLLRLQTLFHNLTPSNPHSKPAIDQRNQPISLQF
jgi:glycosyltransferase involved in cell wall biosynthesis